MAWDTEGTKRRLLDAGARQFAAHGFAGAHMEAIGRDSGVNKERVYQYFGNKRGLFDAVLADRLGDFLRTAGPMTGGAVGIGECAGLMFDQLAEAPDLARLLAWESLELDTAADAVRRADACAARVAEVSTSLPGISDERAAHLLLSVVTLTTGWWTLSRIADMLLPDVDPVARRAEVVAQATAMAERALAAR